MRLFTGIDLPESVEQRLDALIAHLRPQAHLKWSPAYNLHITTKFIGEWDPTRINELQTALRSVTLSSPVNIEVSGLGWFPNPHSPRVFWAGIHGGALLHELAKATSEAVARLGVPMEQREYSPHLTLARIKEPVPLEGIRQAVAGLESVDFGSFQPACFYLYHSVAGQTGSVYKKLQEYPLPV